MVLDINSNTIGKSDRSKLLYCRLADDSGVIYTDYAYAKVIMSEDDPLYSIIGFDGVFDENLNPVQIHGEFMIEGSRFSLVTSDPGYSLVGNVDRTTNIWEYTFTPIPFTVQWMKWTGSKSVSKSGGTATIQVNFPITFDTKNLFSVANMTDGGTLQITCGSATNNSKTELLLTNRGGSAITAKMIHVICIGY